MTELGPSEQDEMVREVATTLTRSAPAGWRRMELIYHSTVGIDCAEILATTTGEPERVPLSMAISKIMSRLRGGMYEKSRGSWFTARLVVTQDGYAITYDYDSEPAFVPPLTADAYALDFEHNPRAAEHTPDWLRAKLTEAKQ